MAFGRTSLGSSAAGGGRATGAGGQRPLSDINVTPLVDVMLVLLVIFIITAPLMASSIKLDLPQTDAGQPNDTPKFVSLSVDASGKVFLNDKPVTDEELAVQLEKPPRTARTPKCSCAPTRPCPTARWWRSWASRTRRG
jgi:biopolymer transport protein TolR